jgi:hypothetical protein
MVAAAICTAPLADLGAGGTSGSIVAALDKGVWRLHELNFPYKEYSRSATGSNRHGPRHCLTRSRFPVCERKNRIRICLAYILCP